MNGITHRKDLGNLTDKAGHDHTDEVVTDETDTLISAEKVIGTPVYNGKGEQLGSIDSLMINKRAGRVAYAVMSFGGFIGVGEHHHPLPWARLVFDEERAGYNIDLSADEFAKAPRYSRDQLDRLHEHVPALEEHYGGPRVIGGDPRG